MIVAPLSNNSCIFFTWIEGSVPTAQDLKTSSIGGLGIRFPLDFDCARNVVKSLERLWTKAPKLAGFCRCLLIAHDDILLNKHGHVRGVLASRACALFPFR